MEYDPPNRVKAYADAKALPFKGSRSMRAGWWRRFWRCARDTHHHLINKRGEIVRKYLGEPDFAALRAVVLDFVCRDRLKTNGCRAKPPRHPVPR